MEAELPRRIARTGDGRIAIRLARREREILAGLADDLVRRRLANPQDFASWQAQAAAGTTFAGVDEPIAAPTLVVTGTADNVVDPRNAEVLVGRIPGSRLVTLEGLGHLFFWEDPAGFVRIVEEFLG